MLRKCLTLGPVVQFKAVYASEEDRKKLAKILPLIGQLTSEDLKGDVRRVGKEIDGLAKALGFDMKLSQYGVPENDLEKIVQGAGITDIRERDDMIELLRSSKL